MTQRSIFVLTSPASSIKRVCKSYSRFPGQVERIDRNAVAAKSWTRIIRGKAERLGRLSANHFVDIDAHTICNNLHLIHQADVHRAMNVFQQLSHLCSFGRAYRNYMINGGFIQGLTDFKTSLGMPPTTLGIVRVSKFGFPGSSRSGEYTRKISSPTFRPIDSARGNNSSSVVPGYVVLSSDNTWPFHKYGMPC